MPSYASGAAGSLPAEASVAMSPPAQNDFPTAFTTSAPTSGLASTSSNVAISSSAIPGVSALRRSGAFSVTTATPPSTSSRTSPEPATSPPSYSSDRPRRRPTASARHQTTGTRSTSTAPEREPSGRLDAVLLTAYGAAVRNWLNFDDIEEFEASARTPKAHRRAAAKLSEWAAETNPDDEVTPADLLSAAGWHLDQAGDT